MEESSVDIALRAWSGLLGSSRSRDIGFTPDRVWEIAAESGTRYVLKEIRYDFHNWPDPIRRFVEEARILGYLSHRGIPVAVPVPSDDGRIVRAGESLYALTPKLAARQGPPDTPAARAAIQRAVGETTARLHLALASCPYTIESERIAGRRIGSSDSWHRLRSALAPELFAELADRVGPWCSRIDAARAGPYQQRVHGDLHGGNILVGDDNMVTGIIDVDHLPIAPRLYDLGYYLMFGIEWACQHDASAETIAATTELETEALISGYHAVSPLTDEEFDALPAMALSTAMGLINFFIAFEGSVRDTWIDTVRQITDHPATLLPPASLRSSSR